ncbi:MAG: copper resistance CopC/CopD family protein [Actinomycetota bacterium]
MNLKQRFASTAAFLAVALATLLSFAPNAFAHATLQSSVPEANATLQTSPSSITLVFSETPDLGLSTVQLLDTSGAVLAGPHAKQGTKPTIVVLAIPRKLPNGSYTISWRVISAVDGHLTAGEFAFGVGEAPNLRNIVVPKTPSPAAGAVAGRFMLLIGLALLFGAAVASILVFRRSFESWSWALPLCFVLAWAGFGLYVISQAHRAGVGLGAFLASSRGGRLKLEGYGLIALAVTAVIASRVRAKAWPRYLLVAAAIDSTVLHVLDGHAAAERSDVYATIVQTAHLLGVGAWVGGFVWLIAGLRSERERGDAAHRFARTAGGALALVALTGFLRALSEVRTWHGLVHTGFGQIVGVKSLLFLPLLALGAFNHYRNVPALRNGASPRVLERFVFAEMFVAIALFAFTGVLTELPPSVSITPTPKPVQVVLSGSDFATTVKVSLTIAPAQPGSNDFTAKIRDFGTGATFQTTRVRLLVENADLPELGSSTIELRKVGTEWTTRSAALSIPGTWKITVEIDAANGAITVPLTLVLQAPPPTITCSPVQGQPTICTATIPGVGSLQVYADPGHPGKNDLHATFFNTAGIELSIKDGIVMRIVDPKGHAQTLQARRFSKGHFISTAKMQAGNYSFIIDAVSKTNQPIEITFTIAITS